MADELLSKSRNIGKTITPASIRCKYLNAYTFQIKK